MEQVPTDLNTIDDNLFLPDFRDVRTLLLAVILTELLAFLLVLAPLSKEGYQWEYMKKYFFTDLALVSLFMQWVMLVSVGLLQILRQWLCQLNSNILVSSTSYLLILAVTALATELVWAGEEYFLASEATLSSIYYPFLFKGLIIGATTSALLLWGIKKAIETIYQAQWDNNTLIVNYFILVIFSILLTKLAFFLLSPTSLHDQVRQHQLFLLRNLGISTIVSAIALRYFYVLYYWEKTTISHAYANIQALQARIRPHFLFNSMNTIASLIRFRPDKAEQAVEDFAELFRASLADAKELVTFVQERNLCEQYLRIESLRLPDRLRVSWNVDTIPDNALMPRLSLQPLLENAIYHGIQPLPYGGTIQVTGLFDGQYIRLEVENPFVPDPDRPQGNRIAQRNIEQRLQAFYGMEARLQIRITTDVYCVSLRFPYQNHAYENLNR